MESLDHGFHGKLVSHRLAALFSKPGAEIWIVGQTDEAVGESFQISGLEKITRSAIKADFAGTVAVEGDGWFAGGERLGNGAGQSLSAR